MNAAADLPALGIQLRSYAAGNHKAKCPRCSHTRKHKADTPLSVTISADGSFVFKCHNCEWAGPGRDERPRAEPAPIKVRPKPDKDPQHPEWMYNFFESRRISRATVDHFGIYVTQRNFGSREEPDWQDCIAFPYFWRGELVNVKYRTKDKRFMQTGKAERTVYNVDALQGEGEGIFVEGEMDVLAYYEAGCPNAVTLPDGAPKTVGDHNEKRYEALGNCADVLQSVEKWLLAGDLDGPGKAHTEELARRLGKERCWRVHWCNTDDSTDERFRKDCNDVLLQDGPKVVRECTYAAEPYPITGLYEVDDYRASVVELFHSGRTRGVSTGWHEVDKFITIRPGDFTVVTGIPNMGKSEWLDALYVNLARLHGWKFGICSFENDPNDHIAKLAEKHVHAPFWDGVTRRMYEGELLAALDWLADHFYFIRNDDEGATIDWILERARVAILRKGIRGLLIDPWNEIDHQRPRELSETEYVSQVLSKIRRFAKVNEVHVWIVAHPSKMQADNGKVPVPSLYDISGSAHWANKCDFGIVVHRDQSVTQIHIRKVRHKWLGQRGMAKLRYIIQSGEYSDDLEALI